MAIFWPIFFNRYHAYRFQIDFITIWNKIKFQVKTTSDVLLNGIGAFYFTLPEIVGFNSG